MPRLDQKSSMYDVEVRLRRALAADCRCGLAQPCQGPGIAKCQPDLKCFRTWLLLSLESAEFSGACDGAASHWAFIAIPRRSYRLQGPATGNARHWTALIRGRTLNLVAQRRRHPQHNLFGASFLVHAVKL